MVRRLLPVRMFNKQEHLGSFYSTKANMTVLISVPPSHTDLRSMRHVSPPHTHISDIPAPFPLPPEEQTHTFPFHSHVSSLVPPPTPTGSTAREPNSTGTPAGARMSSRRGSEELQRSQPIPAAAALSPPSPPRGPRPVAPCHPGVTHRAPLPLATPGDRN